MRNVLSVLILFFLSTAIFAQTDNTVAELPFLEPETIADFAEGRTSITIRSNIRDAAVYLNGNFEGMVTLRLDDIMRGQYHLRVARSGFVAKDYNISVTAGCAQEYFIVLEQQPESGDKTE
ncbi:MAG: PEGA domain-containing protein [Treponema sp.]|nr:PEGA domain-containing protein [Treponema sp.]